MEKICLFTCMTGDYDDVNEIEKKESGVDYYLFTNNKNIKSSTWNVVYIEDKKLDNQRLSRKIKMLGHEIINDNYDILVWQDASIIWNKSIKEFVKTYFDKKKAPFSTFKHSGRDCIYEEAKVCVQERKDTKENVKRTIEYLEEENYPKHNGLCEMTVFIRDPKDEVVKKTMQQWFDMVCTYSKRDQLSFMYCVWKNNLKLNIIDLNVWNNDWFKFNNHRYGNDLLSYRVYFNEKDNNEYNYDYDFQGNFNKKDNIYSIELKVPCDTNKTFIQLPKVPYIKLNSISVNNIKDLDIYYFNRVEYQDTNIFYNENGGFEIYNELKKDDKFKLVLDMSIVNYNDLIKLTGNILTYYEEKKVTAEQKANELERKILELENENKKLNDNLRQILDSKSWKLINKVGKIKGSFTRR